MRAQNWGTSEISGTERLHLLAGTVSSPYWLEQLEENYPAPVSFFFSRHYNTTNPTLHIPLQAGEQLKRDNFRQLPLQAWGLPAWLLVAPAPAVHWPSQWAAAQAGAPKPCEARAQHQGFSSPACSRQHKLLPPHRWRAALSALALTFSSREAGVWAGCQQEEVDTAQPTHPPHQPPNRVHNPAHCPTCLLYFAQQFDWPDFVSCRGSLALSPWLPCLLLPWLPIKLPRSFPEFPGESDPFEESSDWLSFRVMRVLKTDRL